MPEIEVSKVVYNDAERQREGLDENFIHELMESFNNPKIGQLTPIIVTHASELVAGRSRLEAAKRLNWSTIRCEYYEDISPLDRKIIEFEENDKRRQLSWQESAKAIKEIHELKISERIKEGYQGVEGGWSASDTARSLGLSVGKVSEDLTLASSLGNDRVAGRPSRRGALDTLKRERELELVRELARRRAGSLGLADTFNTTSSLTGGVIYNEDCRKILESMAPNSVDLIVTDPPWGIDLASASQWSRRWISTYGDKEDDVRKVLVDVFPLLFKILKPACHLYIFYPIQESQWWVERLAEAGFIVRQRPLVWFKTGQPSITDTYTSFLPCYESILWAFKPGEGDVRRYFSRPVPEAEGFPRESTEWHENSKPIDLLKRWIEASSEVNDVILDPFAGGGSSLVAAFSSGRYFIGCEIDSANHTRAIERLRMLEERKEDETSADPC